MSTRGALKWLQRLERPRSIESLISEVFGEAASYGCLFEREVADILNFLDLATNPAAAMLKRPYDTENFTLNALLKEVKKRAVLSEEQFSTLDDGRDARNELIHRLYAAELVISNADKEKFLARIDALYFRIWKAHQVASVAKKQIAARLGFTEAKAAKMIGELQEEARIEDENLRRLIGRDEDSGGR